MNKLVYLFELDSVRNTPQEIEIGQAAMFEEIARNGNSVVLSFNQLTDSHAFIAAVENKDTYPHILELFRKGAIRISHYGDIRTPSQYMQKSMDNNQGTFVFSGLPVKTTEEELIKKIRLALQYSDPAILTEMAEEKKKEAEVNTDKAVEIKAEADRLEFIDRYIRMILMLSTERLSGNKPFTGEKKNFSDNMDRVIGYYKSRKNKLESGSAEILLQVKEELSAIKDDNSEGVDAPTAKSETTGISKKAKKELGARSSWIKALNRLKESETVYMAEAMTDICYNFTIEESILNVSRHFNDVSDREFMKAFDIRLKKYWEDYKNGIHVFHKADKGESSEYNIKLPHWITAVRMYAAHKENIEFSGQLYEANQKEEKRTWKARVLKSFGKITLASFIYIVILVVIDILMQEMEGFFFDTETLDLGGKLLMAALSSLLFGVLGSIITLVSRLPDFLDAFRSIFHCVLDAVITKRSPRKSYKNNQDGKV